MEAKQVSRDTWALLEERLRRVDYVLNGDRKAIAEEEGTAAKGTATTRLRKLEHTLHQLTSRSPAAAEVLALQKTHPSIFDPSRTTAPPPLPPPLLAQILLSHSQLYTQLNSQLSLLSSTTIPDSAPLAKLVELGPRMERATKRQAELEGAVAELRGRSARAVEWWYETGVLGMGDRWAEWEERLRGVEIAVRRREVAKKRDEGIP